MKKKHNDNIELEELENNELNNSQYRPVEKIGKFFKTTSTIVLSLAAAYFAADQKGWIPDEVKDFIGKK